MPSHLNKFMVMLFALGALGCFGLSQRDSYQTQNQSRYGTPAGPVRTVVITPGDRKGYLGLGVISLTACIYFLARVRRH